MAKILEETEVTLDRADLEVRSPIARPMRKGRILEPERSPGIHLSGVLRYIALESGVMKAVADIDEEALPLRMAMGLAWEEFAVSLYPEIYWQPGEMNHEGVVMTCDGHSVYEETDELDGLPSLECLRLEEFKLTWKKTRSAEELLNEWYWMHQGRGYCWGYDSLLVRWHVCYVMGNYRGSGPQYKRYSLLFTEEEIAKTGKMILANRERAIEKGYAE